MRGCFAVMVAAAAVLIAPSASSAGAGLACGDQVLADVVLQADLVGCSTGLVVGADNVTIDLNGHAILGQSTLVGSGIEAEGRSGVHVRNGRISGFATGVQLFDTAVSSVERLVIRNVGLGISVASGSGAGSNRIVQNAIVDSGAGILVFAPSTLVLDNELADLDGHGILCRSSGHIAGNRVVRAANGIELFFCVADVVGNETFANAGIGIVRVRSEGLVARNRASLNRAGIVSDDSHGLFIRNVTNGNAGHGLSIVDSIDTHGPFHTVADHVAMANGGLGITSNVLGVIQLGNNRAHANGDPRQCVNIVCR